MKVRNFIDRVKNRVTHKKRKPRPALNDLDVKLSKYLNTRGGFFIEAGANDGYSQSNTYFLETKRGWRGLLIEAIPELYERCRQLRRESTVCNCALIAESQSATTITMHYANLMSVVDGSLKSDEKQAKHIRDGINVQGLSGSYDVNVPARTLESILEVFAPNQPIDFFSLDVEGFELNVLRGLNLSRFRPQYILVEANFYDEVDSFLREHQYGQIDKLSYHDYLYQEISVFAKPCA